LYIGLRVSRICFRVLLPFDDLWKCAARFYSTNSQLRLWFCSEHRVHDDNDLLACCFPRYCHDTPYAFLNLLKEMDCYSPAVSVTSDMTDEELDKYFATYVPLSNLPTPPPAKERLQPETACSSTSSPQTRTSISSSSELQGTSLHSSTCHPAPFGSCRPRCWKMSRCSRTAPSHSPA
jgi:hypothetical protein